MTLQLFQNNDVDILIDTKDRFGEFYASIRTVSKVTGIPIEVITSFLNGESNTGVKLNLFVAEIQTPNGVEDMEFLGGHHIMRVMLEYAPDLLDQLSPFTGVSGLFCDLGVFEIKINSIGTTTNPTVNGHLRLGKK